MSQQLFATPAFTPVTIRPAPPRAELLLTLETSVSHHDPARQDDSNVLLFNRSKQLVRNETPAQPVEQAIIDAFCSRHHCPSDVASIARELPFPAFVATCLVRLFMDLYNHGEGVGLFSGMERFDRLETRLRAAAAQSFGLRGLWDRLTTDLQAPTHGGERDGAILQFFALPRQIQAGALQTALRESRSVLAIARLWHSQAKLGSQAYAEKAGQERVTESTALHFDAATIAAPGKSTVIETPDFSINALRHELVRAPGWVHLCRHLGIAQARVPGGGVLPLGVEAIFANGGNIRAGSKQPTNVGLLSEQIRAAYPLLDLLGGVTDSFDLGESRLKPVAWIVCRENKPALAGAVAYDLPNADVSVFEMLDDVTRTRQATERGYGQMIYNFETLCRGVQIYIRFHLDPFTPDLTMGAFQAALDTFLEGVAVIGGQSSRGLGYCRGEWLRTVGGGAELRAGYEAYLAERRGLLLSGLIDGALTTGREVLS